MNIDLIIFSVVIFSIWPIIIVCKSYATCPRPTQLVCIILGAVSFGVTLRYGVCTLWNKWWYEFTNDTMKYAREYNETLAKIQKVIDFDARITATGYSTMLIFFLLSCVSWKRRSSWISAADEILIVPLVMSFFLTVGAVFTTSDDVWIKFVVSIVPTAVYILVVRVLK